MREAALYIQKKKLAVEEQLHRIWTQIENAPPSLFKAMHYSLFAGGKRIRPILAIAASETVGGNVNTAMPVAIAIEFIHTYSLIHDDLPAMDNDDLRRGKPTNHKVFGEATAILAGDGLLTLAFMILSSKDLWNGTSISSDKILTIIYEIASAAGPSGMVGGQQIDIESEGKQLKIQDIEDLHLKKTGALIKASVKAGGIAGGATDEQLYALDTYGENIGLAFQVCDDIIDVEGVREEAGKSIGKDRAQQKNTYPACVGLDEAKRLRKDLLEKALHSISPLGERAKPLEWIARYIVERRR